MWTRHEHGIFSNKLLMSLPGISPCFGHTNRCLSLSWSLWLCSPITELIILQQRQETGVASVVKKHIIIIFITKNQQIRYLFYLHKINPMEVIYKHQIFVLLQVVVDFSEGGGTTFEKKFYINEITTELYPVSLACEVDMNAESLVPIFGCHYW